MKTINKNEKLNNLAKKIMVTARRDVYLNLKFLGLALSYLDKMELSDKGETMTIACDGEGVFYNPEYVVSSFAKGKNLARSITHIVLHCMYSHPFKALDKINNIAWDVACDTAVENIIDEMKMNALYRDGDSERGEVYLELQDQVSVLTAEQLYTEFAVLSNADLEKYTNLFYDDSHIMWERLEFDQMGNGEDNNGLDQGSDNFASLQFAPPSSGDSSKSHENSDSSESDGTTEKERDDTEFKDDDGESDKESNGEPETEGNSSSSKRSSKAKDWQDISSEIMTDLQSFNNNLEDGLGYMLKTLRIECSKKYDFKEFMRKFLVNREVMKVDQEEFDYVYYTYGLSQYGNVPLIENLEYTEQQVLEEIVIAIDTSGSTEQWLVEKFLEQTYSIINQSNIGKRQVAIRIIQCDNAIKSEVTIKTYDEFKDYIENISIVGGGSTDFNPVFNRINNQIMKNEIKPPKGLIYFTDGCGIYPKAVPRYETTFIFYEDGRTDNNYNVPYWAMKLILGKEDLQ